MLTKSVVSGRAAFGAPQTTVIPGTLRPLLKNRPLPCTGTSLPRETTGRGKAVTVGPAASGSWPAHAHMTVTIGVAQHLQQACEGCGALSHAWIRSRGVVAHVGLCPWKPAPRPARGQSCECPKGRCPLGCPLGCAAGDDSSGTTVPVLIGSESVPFRSRKQ